MEAPTPPKMAGLPADKAAVTPEMLIFHAAQLDIHYGDTQDYLKKYVAQKLLSIQAGYAVSYTENLYLMRLGCMGRTRGRLTKRARHFLNYALTDRNYG